jgi:N-acyl-phosphatidylethanolamine-hydrolysing phospholipase D
MEPKRNETEKRTGNLSRRRFIRGLFAGGVAAGLMQGLPLTFLKRTAKASRSIKRVKKKAEGLSLREIAEGKMHHGQDRFINPFTDAEHGNILRVLSWKLFSKNDFESYYENEPETPVTLDWDPIRRSTGLSVTFLKHSCVLIKDRGRCLLIDPVFSSPFWFIKDFSPIEFDMGQIPGPDHILITHGHYDHLDRSTLSSFDRKTHVITPLGYDAIFTGLGMGNRTKLDWFDTFREGEMEITLLPCNHWTMRNPITGPNRSLWGSYIVRTASGPTLFISGDTAYFDRFREIGKEFSIDLAIFNLSAYEPRWFMASSHINPAETVKAFQELGAQHLMIVHWGTFRLGDEPVHFPPLDIRREMERHGMPDRLVHLDHGQTLFWSDPASPMSLPFRKGAKS